MNILLTGILLVNVALLVTILVVFVRVRAVWADIVTFTTSPAEGKPSPLAELVTAIADSLARSLVAQIKATFMGKQSGAVRGENAIEADLAQDTNPLIAGIAQAFPSVGKSLRRNPMLAQFVLNKLGMSGDKPVVTAGDNGHSQVKFKF